MKIHRLGLLAAAIAAVALTGCDDSSDSGPGSIKITTENAPDVGGDGADLMASAMDIDDEVNPDAVLPGAVMLANAGGKPQGLTFIKLGELVRADAEAGALAALTSPSLATGAAVTTGEEVDCNVSGNYNYFSNSSAWGITYNSCVNEYSEEGEDSSYESRYTMDGTATGTYYGGGWEAEYENLRTTYKSSYDNPEGSGTYSGSYETNGRFEYFTDYGGYGGVYGGITSNYVATDLTVKYSYNATGDAQHEGDDYKGSGTIVYDTYNFKFNYYAGTWYWQGNLYARDSERGIWSISTPQPFGTNYCDRDVFGMIIISGRINDDDHSGGGGSNVLEIIGNGDNLVTYDLYEADGETLISSEDHDWFEYYSNYSCLS